MSSTASLNIAPARVRAVPPDRMKALSQDVMDEAVAGLLWMYLKVPKDASRDELQDYAHEIVRRVHAGAPETAIADYIRALQSDQLCELPNLPVIHDLARRTIGVVRQASISLQSAA